MQNNKGWISIYALLIFVFLGVAAFSAFTSKNSRHVQSRDSGKSGLLSGLFGTAKEDIKTISDGGFLSPSAKKKEARVAGQTFATYSSVGHQRFEPATVAEAYPDLSRGR